MSEIDLIKPIKCTCGDSFYDTVCFISHYRNCDGLNRLQAELEQMKTKNSQLKTHIARIEGLLLYERTNHQKRLAEKKAELEQAREVSEFYVDAVCLKIDDETGEPDHGRRARAFLRKEENHG